MGEFNTKTDKNRVNKPTVGLPDMQKMGAQPDIADPAGDSIDPMLLQRMAADPGSVSPRNIQAVQRTFGNRASTDAIGQASQNQTNGGAMADQNGPSGKGNQPNGGGSDLMSLMELSQEPAVDKTDPAAGASDRLKVHRRTSAGSDGMIVASNTEQRIEEKRGTGEPLANGTRQSMEQSFGADFGGVRVHHDSESHQLNRSLDARAFTTDQDVFFGQGEYNPDTQDGDELIAHELTHVVQQGGASTKPQAKLEVNEPGDAYEQEADAMAQQVVNNPQPASDQPAAGQLAEEESSLSGLQTVPLQREEGEDGSEEEGLTKEEEEEQKKEVTEAGQNDADAGPSEAKQAETLDIPEPDVPELEVEAVDIPEPDGEFIEPEVSADEIEEEHLSEVEEIEDQVGQETEPYQDFTYDSDWQAETILYDLFASVAGVQDGELSEDGEANSELQTMSKAVPNVQRTANDTGSGGGEADPGVRESAGSKLEGGDWAVEKKEGEVVAVPRHENAFADAIIGDTAGKAAEAINSFSMKQESNGFGYTAATLEGLILLSEVITNVLGLVSLVLSVVSLLMFGIAYAMYALGMALASNPFTAGVGVSLISASLTLLGWAISMVNVIAQITTIMFYISAFRIPVRLLALYFRFLDYMYAVSQGATAEELQRKKALMIGNSIGVVTDGISVALGPGKSVGSLAVGNTTVKYAGQKAALGAGRVGLMTAGHYAESQVQLQEDDEAGGDGTLTVGDPPPYEAVLTSFDASSQLEGAAEERVAHEERINEIEAYINLKLDWGNNMGVAQDEIESDIAAHDATDEALDEQMEMSDQFTEQANQAQEPAKEAQAQGGQAAKDAGNSQGAIEQNQGTASSYDSSAQKEDTSGTAGGMSDGSKASEQSGQVASEGAADAQASKEVSAGLQEESGEHKETAQAAHEEIGETKDLNQDEIDMLEEMKQESEDRIAEIEADEQELQSLHAESEAEASEWQGQAEGQRESETEPQLREQIGDEPVDEMHSAAEEGGAEADAAADTEE